MLRIDPEIEARPSRSAESDARETRRRSTKACAATNWSAAPRTGENLVPAILTAVEAYATVGEISDAMRRSLRRIPRIRSHLTNSSFLSKNIGQTNWI